MQIIEERKDHTVTLKVSGRLDVDGSAAMAKELGKWLPSPVIWTIVLDFSGVEYISSAGIRVVLSAHKTKKEHHELIIRNPSQFCKQVFEVTGADIFLKIEYV